LAKLLYGCARVAFYIVDVFAEEKYAGNQLAVIRDAQPLSTVEMQKIAKEMHFSETTFLLSDKKRYGHYGSNSRNSRYFFCV
jgi:trans-2,3-dihydro-3-hydroxyanthranilate isomerase